MTIAQLNKSIEILEEDKPGIMNRRFYEWQREVSLLSPLDGVGSPEGVVEANQFREYIDTTGAAGAIKYVKRDADIAGDRTMGWILI